MELIADINQDLEKCCAIPNPYYNEINKEIVCLNCASIVGNYYCINERIADKSKKIQHSEILDNYSSTLTKYNINHFYKKNFDFKKWNKLSKINTKYNRSSYYCTYYFNVLMKTFNENISKNIEIEANKIMNYFIDKKISRGRTLESLVESSIYLAYQLNGLKYNYGIFFEKFKIKKNKLKLREFNYFFNLFKNNNIEKIKKTEFNNIVLGLQNYLLYLSNIFKVSDEIKINLIQTSNSNIINNKIFQGKSFWATASGLFYYICKKNDNDEVNIEKISEFTKYSKSTIKRGFKSFCRLKLKNEIILKKDLTKNLVRESFMTINKLEIVSNLKKMLDEFSSISVQIKQLLKYYSVP